MGKISRSYWVSFTGHHRCDGGAGTDVVRPQHRPIGRIPRRFGIERAVRSQQRALVSGRLEPIRGEVVEMDHPQRLGGVGRGMHGQSDRARDKRASECRN